ncbi:hypothetical protein cyc_01587 [Cyclospora cayetanensis]|uniref:Uncharacterized protein n=1 Tax=Cyclospora cayetanensis TaxID=88456 RepID=A0A1D3D342_9EIME|nr:hypothetical protein cyc_01587 [Cyclospora cayetanensis]
MPTSVNDKTLVVSSVRLRCNSQHWSGMNDSLYVRYSSGSVPFALHQCMISLKYRPSPIVGLHVRVRIPRKCFTELRREQRGGCSNVHNSCPSPHMSAANGRVRSSLFCLRPCSSWPRSEAWASLGGLCHPFLNPGAQEQRRFFGVGGSYGYGAFFRGEADAAAQSNVRRQRLKDEETHYTGPMTLKMPEMVAALVAEGALRRQVSHTAYWTLQRPQRSDFWFVRSPLKRPGVYVYHHHVPQSPQKSLVYFSATTQQAGAPAAAAATSMLQQRERGVAAQLILDGRGVKAYFDPEWPDLMVRLGVGVKPLALRRLAEQYATRARIFIDKRGLLLTIHGWDKRAVGTLTMELYRHLKANPYTGKGARIAFYPVNRKVSTKK